MKAWTAALAGAVFGAAATVGYFEVAGSRRGAAVEGGAGGETAIEAGGKGAASGGAGAGSDGRTGRGGGAAAEERMRATLQQLTHVQLLAQAQQMAAERDRVQAELDALQATVHVDKDRDIKPYALDKPRLALLATRCQLTWDMPSLGGQAELNLADAKRLGFDDTDRGNINKVLADNDAYVTGELRKLYVEVTGDTSGSGSLSAESMWKEIEDKSPVALKQQIFQKLSGERAGGGSPAGEAARASPAERMFRLITADGDRVEKQLSAQVGPDLARKYRDLYNGFSGRYTSSYGCPKVEAP